MSHLATTYALGAGVKLAEPSLHDAFYPLSCPIDKVILIHAFAGAIAEQNGQRMATFPAKIYTHFAEVVRLIKPVVEPLGYRLFQIGGQGEPPLNGVEYLCGRTTMHQCAYLVKNAALLVGNDSMWAHVRGAERMPLVVPYGSTDPKNHGPYWCDPAKTILIESHRAGKKPSYSSQEHPKTIDWIRPEQIAQAAFDLLGISQTLTHQTYFIGQDYPTVSFEIVPNILVNPAMNVGVPVVRMDFHFDEQLLGQNLSVRKCAVITDREINPNLLFQFKAKITVLRAEVDKLTEEWIKTVRRIGIPLQAVSRETDPEKLSALRLKLYNACLLDQVVDPGKEDARKEIERYLNRTLEPSFDLHALRFRSHRFILSANKVYLSTAHFRADKPAASIDENHGEVIDSPEFWADQKGHFYYT